MQIIIRYSKREEMLAEYFARGIPMDVTMECTDKPDCLKPIPVTPNSHSPNTMMLVGAAVSGGDALKLAKNMTEQG